MTTDQTSSPPPPLLVTMRHRRLLAVALLYAASMSVAAQEPVPPTATEYGQWEALGRSSVVSRDGEWLAYPIARSNGEDELRIANTVTDVRTVAPFGEDAAFSTDSNWLAYAIGHSEEAAAKLQASGEAEQRDMGLLDLTTFDVEVINNVATFAFSEGGAYLAVHRDLPLGNDEHEEHDAATPDDPTGHDLVVRDLSSGADMQFANVSAFAWQDDGALLAMTIAAKGRTGNGVQLFNALTGNLRALESNNAVFSGLSWRKDADDLAVLRSHSVDGYDGATHSVLVWRNLQDAPASTFVYNPADDTDFPSDFRIVDDRQPTWSDDGTAVFFGVKPWEAAPKTDSDEAADSNDAGDENDVPEEAATVDVWHAKDRRIIPMQKVQAQRDRERSLLAAWHLNESRFVQLATDLMEEVSLMEGQAFAIAQHTDPYAFDSMFGRRWMDIHLVDVKTGTRINAVEHVRHLHGSSATGRYVLYFKDGHFWTYEVANGQQTNLTQDLPTSFADAEFDHPTEQRPAYGVAGWETSDESVLLYDRYDVWRVAPGGTSYARLTNGAQEEIRHRYVELEDDADGIDLAKPFYVSVYGQWTKKSGYARITVEDSSESERLVWLDSQVDRIVKAADAELYAYVVQRFNDSPDYFVSGPDLSSARQVSNTNSFQKDYAWGHSELVDYRTPDGQRLQGALFYPANYDSSRQYPMIVYVYELRSQITHGYVPPSERRPYNTTVFTSQGYFVLQPDIVYRDRDPGVSATECVEAAVAQVLKMGIVDPQQVGLVGHSWGGYETAFIPTQTDTFAAAVTGAPLTNFFSMFGTIHWNQGMPETSHFETGQARMDVPYWDDMEAYIRNSPVMFIRELDTPMLMAFGDADGTVDWHQGVELYNYARRAGKHLVMLVYADENHSLRRKPNQIDYHHRVLDWFDHYLKGQSGPAWITDGVSVLARERELRER